MRFAAFPDGDRGADSISKGACDGEFRGRQDRGGLEQAILEHLERHHAVYEFVPIGDSLAGIVFGENFPSAELDSLKYFAKELGNAPVRGLQLHTGYPDVLPTEGGRSCYVGVIGPTTRGDRSLLPISESDSAESGGGGQAVQNPGADLTVEKLL